LQALVLRTPEAVFQSLVRDPVLAARLVAWSAANGITRRACGLRRLLGRLRGARFAAFVESTLSRAPAASGEAHSKTDATASAQLFEALRRHAGRVAHQVRADAARSSIADPEAAHLAALLEGLGMFVLAHLYPDPYLDLLAESPSRSELRRRERQRFGTDHVAVRRRLAHDWGLPEWLTRATRSLPGGPFIAREVSQCGPVLEAAQSAPPVPTGATANQADPGFRITPETAFALVRLVADYERLQTERDAALEREKLDSLAQFAAGAGHEINNPLAVIYGRAQLLLAGESDPERRRALLTVGTQAMRIHEMIADLMLFARPPEPRRQVIELAPLAADVLKALSTQASELGVTLRFQPAAKPVSAWADPVQIRVVLVSLLNNSLEALGRGGTVEVALASRKRRRTVADSLDDAGGKNGSPPPAGSGDGSDEFAVLHVTDDGPGLSDEARRHLFDPFYSGREAGRGLGLGLAKCWRIVTAHGGTIRVRSRPGQGTALTVLLPTSPAGERLSTDRPSR
jgi:signal transduction histidine kinase